MPVQQSDYFMKTSSHCLRNIFLKSNLVKLGDFGISRILMGTSDLATTFTGTPYYMSPEVLKHDGYNAKSDIWSLACILYELYTLQHAFRGQVMRFWGGARLDCIKYSNSMAC